MRPLSHDERTSRNRRRCASALLHLPLPFFFSFLLALAAFSLSLLATVKVTRTLTSWRIETSSATRWGGNGKKKRERSSGVDDDIGSDVGGGDLDLGSLLGERRATAHLSLFDDDDEEAEIDVDDDGADAHQQPPAGACAPMEHTDYFGTPIVEGPDFVVSSAQECCEACANYKPTKRKRKEEKSSVEGEEEEGQSNNSHLPCSVWVFCGDGDLCGDSLGQCWLKHLAWPEASNPRTGPEVPWTSGLRSGALSPALEEERGAAEEEEEKRDDDGGSGESGGGDVDLDLDDEKNSSNRSRRRRSYHVAITASGPAVHWQSRVHYYWYLKQKRACEERERREEEEAEASSSMSSSTSSTEKKKKKLRKSFRCEMGGFTRILHDAAGTPDDLSREIPTFVASPLPAGADGGYVVLNRPWAFVQWLAAAAVDEEFVLMAEPDHLWLRPFQNPCPPDGSPAAFPFFYIEPSKEEYLPLVARALGKKTGQIALEEAERIAPIGNSPTWMRTADLRAVAPRWMETSRRMFADARGARRAWGWVLEMYGFAVSLHGRAEEARRWGEERAKFSAVVAERRTRRRARKEKEERQQNDVGDVDVASSSTSTSFFPPLSPDVVEAVSRGRKRYRREQEVLIGRKKEEESKSESESERSNNSDGGGERRRERRREEREEEEEAAARPTKTVEVLPRVMLQPPWDSRVTRGAALLHYTYGCDYSLNGTFLPGEKGAWRFDKREWGGRRVDESDETSKIVPAPPSRRELRSLLESAPLELRETAPATLKIVEMLLEAAEAIPGWDEYAERGVAEEWWDGKTFL